MPRTGADAFCPSVVAPGPCGPVAYTAHRVERQPLGARVFPAEQRAVLRLGARYELLTRKRMREATHVQAFDVPVAVYAHLALERHPLLLGGRFRVVGVRFPGVVVVQVLRWRSDGGTDGRGLQGRGSGLGRAAAQQERLPGRGVRGRSGSGYRQRFMMSLLLQLLLLLRVHRRERVVRVERQRRVRERLERTDLERRRLERGRLERHRQSDVRRRLLGALL